MKKKNNMLKKPKKNPKNPGNIDLCKIIFKIIKIIILNVSMSSFFNKSYLLILETDAMSLADRGRKLMDFPGICVSPV